MTREPIKEPSGWMLFLGMTFLLGGLVLLMFMDF